MTIPSLPEPGPPLAQLLSRPSQFFAALSRLSPQPWRYLGLVALAGLTSGLAAAVAARSTVQAQAALHLPGLSAPMTYGTLVFSGLFLEVVAWLLLWFLGNLGAGSRGRAAEVWGATFGVQVLWSLLLVLLGLVVQPDITVAAPHLQGLDAQHSALAVQKYNQAVAAQVAAHPAYKLTNIAGYAVYLWQLALAYLGFKATTQHAGKSMQGVAYPAALFVVLGLALWLLNQAVGKMVGS